MGASREPHRVEELVFRVEGMSCAACQLRVSGALGSVAGVREARVNLLAHRATVRFDPSKVAPEALVAAVERAGFDASLPLAPVSITDRTQEDGAIRAAEARHLALRAGLATATTVLAVVGGGHGHGFGLLPHRAAPFLDASLAGVSLLIGFPIFARGARELAARAPGMDALVAIGCAAATLLSAGAWLHVAGFDGQHHAGGVPPLIAALLVGRALESRAKAETLVAQAELAALLPSTATLLRDGEPVHVATRELLPGDLVRVRAGETFPCDGTIENGASEVDEAAVTGESVGVQKGVGDAVLGATRNGFGELLVRARAVGDQAVVGAILEATEAAQRDRGAMENLAERAVRPFVPAMLLVALVTTLAWWLREGAAAALVHGANVLLVACPCAVGLAIPAAVTVALGRASKLGILIRRGSAFERAATVTHVFFDKTGTLTTGEMRVVAALPEPGVPAARLRTAAAIAEAGLEHPLARALQEPGRSAFEWSREVVPGHGVRATRGEEVILVGHATFVRGRRAEALPSAPLQTRCAHSTEGPHDRDGTSVDVAWDGQILGTLIVGDSLRPSAPKLLGALRSRGVSCTVLTGDEELHARTILAPLDVPIRARLSPTDKRAAIDALRGSSPRACALFVGDGLNDAPALAAADVSIAIASGTALARSASDVLVLTDDLTAIASFLALARATVATMRRNLAWAVVYNTAALPIAAGLLEPVGLAMSPSVAGAAMAASSLGVLVQSLALRRAALAGS